MYPFLLILHNLLRWVVIIVGIVVPVLGWIGWMKNRSWTKRDRVLGIIFTSALDIQLLLGLLLYLAFSPLTTAAFRDFGAAMQNSAQRFFAVEHLVTMLLGIGFAHVGFSLSKKATQDRDKFRHAAIWFSLAILIILVGTPWMRPLLRGF